jgi:excinuclease ABC subunit C
MSIENNNANFNLKTFLKNIPSSPGIYRMYDANSVIIYVGKAKNLKKRVNSYFSGKAKDSKTIRLVRQIDYVEVTVVNSDYEAYILESNLIKRHRPKYNILFKDDKAYPYIVVSGHKFPKVYGYRGKKNKTDTYYGPYVSLSSVKDTLALLQKIFRVRQCKDSFFNARTRPCLQYQIKRCTAPCVGYIDQNEYAREVEALTAFLTGNLNDVLALVGERMEVASESESYELAAKYRDQLMLLRKLQEQQYMNAQSDKNYEVIGVHEGIKSVGVSLLQVSQGKVLGEKSWLIKSSNKIDGAKKAIEQLFIEHYLTTDRSLWPDSIIIENEYLPEIELLELISQQAKRSIEWLINPRGLRHKWLQIAHKNAINKIAMTESVIDQYYMRVTSLCELLEVKDIHRLECFDVSHLYGEQTIAACVVFGKEGAIKSEYRKYNINDVTGGDDYAAMSQAVSRRIKSGVEKLDLPDVLIIDGGKGQLKKAVEVLQSYNLLNDIKLIGLGKGPERKSGFEDIFIYPSYDPIKLDQSHPGFLLLREVRDEAHRFSITSQRNKSLKKHKTSVIEKLSGIGEIRSKSLLLHFGGWQELEKASIEEISKVKGIGKVYAEKIWYLLH